MTNSAPGTVLDIAVTDTATEPAGVRLLYGWQAGNVSLAPYDSRYRTNTGSAKRAVKFRVVGGGEGGGQGKGKGKGNVTIPPALAKAFR